MPKATPMTQTLDTLQPASTHPPKSLRNSLGTVLLYGLGFAILAGSYNGADIRPWDLIEDSSNMAEYGAEFFPPDFGHWQFYLEEIIKTLQIAVWGTFLAIV